MDDSLPFDCTNTTGSVVGIGELEAEMSTVRDVGFTGTPLTRQIVTMYLLGESFINQSNRSVEVVL